MDFFKKKLKLTFSCSPDYYTAFELYKPTYAAEFSPPWLKNIPALIHEKDERGVVIPRASIKRCAGLQWTLTNGFILPLWTDICLVINPDGTFGYQCADLKTSILSHPSTQIPGFYNGYTNLKIISPWAIKSSHEVKFYWTSPYYYYDLPTKYVLAPGIMEYKFNHSTNINLFLPVQDKPYQFMLNAGDPIVHMIDTNFTKFDVTYELLKDPLEFYSKYNFNSDTSFVGQYFKRRKKLAG